MSIRLVNTKHLGVGQDAADLTDDEVIQTYDHVNTNNRLLSKFISKSDTLSALKGDVGGSSTSYYKTLDDFISLPTSGIVVIAGRPGHGKSSLMRNLALRKALEGDKVVYITYEFSQQEEVLNFASVLQGRAVKVDDALSGTNIAFEKIGDLLGVNLFISHELRNIEDIRDALLTPELKGSAVFIDYIQKIPSSEFKGESIGSEAQIRYVCNVLNDIVITNNILIVTGSQLTQSVNSALQDSVKGAKAIEEVASVLLRIWRHNINEASALNDQMFKYKNFDFTIDILKNRRGKTNRRLGMMTQQGTILLDESEYLTGNKYLLNFEEIGN